MDFRKNKISCPEVQGMVFLLAIGVVKVTEIKHPSVNLHRMQSSQKDIARICGVSRSAVSAALVDKPTTAVVGNETRKRILKVVKELEYRPNSAAMALRNGKSNAVVLAIPDIRVTQTIIGARMLRGIFEKSQELGYAFHICSYQENSDIRVSLYSMVKESRVDGVFFYGAHRYIVDPRRSVLEDLRIPFVELEKSDYDSDSVDFDHFNGAYQATKHLLEQGRRRIVFVGEDRKIDYSAVREDGYISAMSEFGLVEPLIVHIGGDYMKGGGEALQTLHEKNIVYDSLLCVDDLVALGAMQELVRKRNIRVPDDIAVVGYDDSSMAELSIPKLTSVFQDGVKLGHKAMELLHRRIGDPSAKSRCVVLPVELRVRESSVWVR